MAQATSTRMSDKSPAKRAWAYGGMIFAATMLVVIGVYQLFLGIAAISRQAFFVVAPNYYYEFSTRTWGWIHFGLGIVAILVGLTLFTGMTWARVAGIIMAGLSAIANFFFLPYYPLWSLLIIALDIFVIWALATVGNRREVAEMKEQYLESGEVGAVGTSGGTRADMNEGERWPATNKPGERGQMAEPPKAPAEGGMSTTGSTAGDGGTTRPSAFTGNPPSSGNPRS